MPSLSEARRTHSASAVGCWAASNFQGIEKQPATLVMIVCMVVAYFPCIACHANKDHDVIYTCMYIWTQCACRDSSIPEGLRLGSYRSVWSLVLPRCAICCPFVHNLSFSSVFLLFRFSRYILFPHDVIVGSYPGWHFHYSSFFSTVSLETCPQTASTPTKVTLLHHLQQSVPQNQEGGQKIYS